MSRPACRSAGVTNRIALCRCVVEQDGEFSGATHDRQRLESIGRFDDSVAGRAQHAGAEAPNVCVVVYDEDRVCLVHGRGSGAATRSIASSNASSVRRAVSSQLNFAACHSPASRIRSRARASVATVVMARASPS